MAKESTMTYKEDTFENCVIRYDPKHSFQVWVKFKDKPEHEQDSRTSNVASEAVMNGKEITKEEYDAF